MIAVGAWSHQIGSAAAAGQAYVFVKPSTGWQLYEKENVKLLPTISNAGFMFGSSVSATDGVIFVGEPQAPSSCTYTNCGTGDAYVFVEPSTGWPTTTVPLLPTTQLVAAGSPPTGSQIGFSIAGSSYNGDTAIVGAPQWHCNCGPGFAYIYQPPNGLWPTGTMTPTATLSRNTNNQDIFGFSVAINLVGNMAVVGAPNATCKQCKRHPLHGGSAYIFGEPTGGWVNSNLPNTTLYASDGATGDFFGSAVSTSSKGYDVIVGAELKKQQSR